MKSNLRAERARLDMTAAEVADAIGVHVNMVYRYESGESEPRGSVLVKMAALFGCSPEYLLGLTDERNGRVTASK